MNQPVELHPVASMFAADLEASGMEAMQAGLPPEQYWHVLATFAGYSLGNAPGTNAVAIQNAVDLFAKMVRDVALARFLEARKEARGNG